MVEKDNSHKYQNVVLQFLNVSICILPSFLQHSPLIISSQEAPHREKHFQGNVKQMAFSNLPQKKMQSRV